jgi:hypothetical protein
MCGADGQADSRLVNQEIRAQLIDSEDSLLGLGLYAFCCIPNAYNPKPINYIVTAAK